MQSGHSRRISASDRAAFRYSHYLGKSVDRGIAVSSIDIVPLITREDSIDFFHRTIGISRAGIDWRRGWLTGRRFGTFAGMNQLRVDVQVVFIVSHRVQRWHRLQSVILSVAFHSLKSVQLAHTLQKRSLRYLSPPSHRMVTTTESGGRLRASARAATTFAPELPPTNKPSSRDSRRVIACAASVSASTVSSARVGSKMPGMREVGKCFSPSSP